MQSREPDTLHTTYISRMSKVKPESVPENSDTEKSVDQNQTFVTSRRLYIIYIHGVR